MSFCVLDDFFRLKKKGFLGILGPPYCGIGATIRIGREMLCLPYAGFFQKQFVLVTNKRIQKKTILEIPFMLNSTIDYSDEQIKQFIALPDHNHHVHILYWPANCCLCPGY